MDPRLPTPTLPTRSFSFQDKLYFKSSLIFFPIIIDNEFFFLIFEKYKHGFT